MLNENMKKVFFVVAFCSFFSVFVFSPAYAIENPTGKVIETMNSAGYTYALIEKNDTKTWVAAPQMLLSVGDEVEFLAGMAMGSYTSKTLGRSFDDIIFSSGVVAIEKASISNGAEAVAEKVIVEKAAGPDAYTIAELYEKKADLVGKRVVVRGTVYKVSKFKGSTWIRIKDGSGSRKKGNHKLIVTSNEMATKSEVVTLAGILAADKNVGGLTFEVVVEQATLQP